MIRDLFNPLRRLWRPLIALAVVAVGFALSASSAHASTLVQVDAAAQLLDLVEQLGKLLTFVGLVIPLTEVRKAFGGLPDIPLPGGHSIRSGRYVSWIVTGLLAAYGHQVGWLQMPSEFPSIQLWWAAESGILAVVSNYVYTKWFAPKPPVVEPLTHTAFGR